MSDNPFRPQSPPHLTTIAKKGFICLNLTVEKWKTTLWSNWAWPWSRQSCCILFHFMQNLENKYYFLFSYGSLLKISKWQCWNIQKFYTIIIWNDKEWESILLLSFGSKTVYKMLTRLRSLVSSSSCLSMWCRLRPWQKWIDS